MVEVEGLTFSYGSADSPALQDLTFSVARGEVFGVLGPSGAGKSTTQNILIGLLHGWRGRIEVLGRPLHEWGADYYATIGVGFELPNHYLKLTARENLEFFRALYRGETESIEDALALVGLEEEADKPVGSFSKGMKIRLNIVRSLLHRPQLWFLDEPTSGLDPVNIRRIRELIQDRQQEGVTTLITTHDMLTAEQICDRVAFIVDGQIAAIDTPDALRHRYGSREVEVRWNRNGQEETEGDSARFPLDGLAENKDFLQTLRRDDLASLHSLETTLEDVFVQVTGRAVR